MPSFATDRPVFGVLTEPMDPSLPEHIKKEGSSMIEASHVKFLESAGAYVIPIDYKENHSTLKRLLSVMNGLYIPGDD